MDTDTKMKAEGNWFHLFCLFKTFSINTVKWHYECTLIILNVEVILLNIIKNCWPEKKLNHCQRYYESQHMKGNIMNGNIMDALKLTLCSVFVNCIFT